MKEQDKVNNEVAFIQHKIDSQNKLISLYTELREALTTECETSKDAVKVCRNKIEIELLKDRCKNYARNVASYRSHVAKISK